MTPTEYPCKVRPGYVFYSFNAHGQTLGLSDRPGRHLDLAVEKTDTQITLVVVDRKGDPAVDVEGHTSALVLPRAQPRSVPS